MPIDRVYSKARLKVRVDYHILLFHRSILALLYAVEVHCLLYFFGEGQSFTVTRPAYLRVCLTTFVCGSTFSNLIAAKWVSHMLWRGRSLGTTASHKLRATIVCDCTHWHIGLIRALSSTSDVPSHVEISLPALTILWERTRVGTFSKWRFKQKTQWVFQRLWMLVWFCKWTEQSRNITQEPFELYWLKPDLCNNSLDRLHPFDSYSGFMFSSHSAASACARSPSLRNLLTCPVAMTSVECVGKGKSYLVWPEDSADLLGVSVICICRSSSAF